MSRKIRSMSVALAVVMITLSFCGTAVMGEAVAVNEPTAVTEPVKLAEKTPVKLKTIKEMISGKVSVGEAVQFEVAEDLKDTTGRILVAYGAKGIGKVTVSKRRGMMGKQGKLEFTVESIEAVDGTRVPVRAGMESSGKSNSGAVIASALILSVFAVFISGRDITLKAGTEFTAYVAHETLIQVPVAKSTLAATAVADATTTQPAAPEAKLVVASSLIAGSNVVGELRNDGPNACGAELIAMVKKDDKAVGAGTLVLDKVDVNQVRAFSIPVQGSVDGVLSVSVQAKPLPAAPAAPISPAPTPSP